MRLLRSRGFLLLILLLSGGVLWRYVIADWLAERRWQKYMTEATARGIRLTLPEYRPAPVPPEEDIALLPVFASSASYEPLLKQVPYLAHGRKRQDGAPRPIDWKATRAKLSQHGLADDSSEPDDLRALDSATRVFQPLIDQLRDSKATAGNWGDDVWTVNLDSNFSKFTTATKCARLLEYRARLDLALGRPADARRSIEAQLRLSSALRKMPLLITHLVAISAQSMAREALREGLQVGAWDDESLRAFSEYFRQANELADFQWTMETERAWSREFQHSLRADPGRLTQLLAGSSLGKFDEVMLRFTICRPAWHRNNQLWYERAQDELAGTVDAQTGIWRSIDPKFDPEKLTLFQRNVDLTLAAQAISSTQTFAKKAVWVHAQNKMAAIACALELARRASGKYPATLDALVPGYMPELPIDPVSGTSFRYTVQPDGFYRLYSVGFDGKDQGGEISGDIDRDLKDPDWPWFGPSAREIAK